MMVEQLQVRWAFFKDALADAFGTSHRHLHVIIGLLLLALSAFALRRRWPSWWLLAPVAALQALNELSDATLFYRAVEWKSWSATDALIETVLTIGPPAAVIAIAKITPARFG